MSVAQAVKLARAFFGRKFKPSFVHRARFEPEAALVRVGEVTQINYLSAVEPAAQLAHAFPKHRRPGLFVTSDGKTVIMPLGKSKFTGRGFVP